MAPLFQSFWAHPFWVWTAASAALLAVEVVTGSGYLLWACASAAVVGLLALTGAPLGWAAQALLFAGLSIASTLLARRFWPRRRDGEGGPDINGVAERLVGMRGEMVSGDADRPPRVFVDGKEWIADAGEGALLPGTRVEVISACGGSRLRVRPV